MQKHEYHAISCWALCLFDGWNSHLVMIEKLFLHIPLNFSTAFGLAWFIKIGTGLQSYSL